MNIRHLAILSAAFLAVSCAPKGPEKQEPVQQTGPAAPPISSAQGNYKEMTPEMDILKDPSKATEKAPDNFKVKFTTTKGDFIIEVTRAWSPLGADRFYNLVKAGFFTDVAFFRVIQGFMAQFGIHGDPAVASAWRGARIQDDPVKESNGRGYVSYAMAGPNTRTTQFFINYGDNARLDGMGFSPFGMVAEGMHVVDALYSGYGEGAPSGNGPDQGRVQMQGNAYLKKDFPSLDYIKSAQLLN